MSASVDTMVDAFIEFAKALETVLTGETLTSLLSRIAQLPGEAKDVQEKAKPQFESLGKFDQVRALPAMVSNIAEIVKIPEALTKKVGEFKKLMEDLKATVEFLKNNLSKIAEDGKKCKAAGKSLPVECYTLIEGPMK